MWGQPAHLVQAQTVRCGRQNGHFGRLLVDDCSRGDTLGSNVGCSCCWLCLANEKCKLNVDICYEAVRVDPDKLPGAWCVWDGGRLQVRSSG